MVRAAPPEPVTLSAPETPEHEPVLCGFCDAAAERTCPRCGAMYCTRHGDSICDACSDPAAGVPSRGLVYTVATVLGAATVTALVLLVSRPRLPSEHPPAAGAAPTVAATSPATNGAGGPSPAGAATAAPATPAAPSSTYIIKAGDTINAIATQSGVTSDALIAANPGINPGALQIGQQITIPAH